jgi:hypothetical protein
MAEANTTKYRWRFFRAGNVAQVTLGNGADLANLANLDQKLWVVLACPTRGLEIDARTLDFVDTDHDGRIRPPEILGAVAWAQSIFGNLDLLFKGGDGVRLASINRETDAGKEVLAGAQRVLKNLGTPDAEAITLADVGDTQKIFEATRLNGDGILPADSADDPAVKTAIEEIIAAMGSKPDRSGKPGVDQETVDLFFDQAVTYADWLDRGDGDPAVRVLGPRTDDAAAALAAVITKVDDYFARCALAAYDGRVTAGLTVTDAEIAALAGTEIAPEDTAVGKLPLARCEAGRPLPLGDGVNPAWRARTDAFAGAVVGPLFGDGKTSLTEPEWADIKGRFAAYRAWMAERPASAAVGGLGPDRVRTLARGEVRKAITDLVAQDAALAPENNQIEAIEKTIRFQRDLVPLLRNFVNFADFYQTRLAAFQAGTLYIDGRSCDLCLPVHDVAKHATLATLARAYLVYCDCKRRKDAEKMTIVAGVTGGDVNNLMAGRNGVFYDRKGNDWDATITRIVENPISVRQAFLAPYNRFMRLIEEQITKRAATADEASNKSLQEGAVATASADKSEAAAAEKKAEKTEPAKKIDVGTVAAIGVAVGGIATFFSSIAATFLGLGMWMPAGIVALILAISGPSMLIAWLKLRQRNIGPILDANGWAVNAFARINVPFGAALTTTAKLPAGATMSFRDPFAEKRRPWGLYFTVLIVLGLGALWALGRFDLYLPDSAKSETILHRSETPPSPPAP